MPISPEVASARGRHRVLAKHRGPNHPDTLAALRELKALAFAEHLRRHVDEWGPLTDDEYNTYALIMRPPADGRASA